MINQPMPLTPRVGSGAKVPGHRPAPSRRILLSLVAVLGLMAVVPLGSVPTASAAPGDRDVPDPVEVVLAADGFMPSAVALTTGQTLVLRNDSATEQVMGPRAASSTPDPSRQPVASSSRSP